MQVRPVDQSETQGPLYPRGAAVAARFRNLYICCLAALVGVGAGLVAFVLLRLIGLLTNLIYFGRVGGSIPGLEGNVLGAWVLAVPALGGLAIGLMARFGSDKIRGHGIPEAMEAILVQKSRIAPRVALLKPLSAAIAIGTGGPFGAEGPIIQTGGALGSIAGQVLRMTASERKVLLACGAAAGMAGTFNTPIAAVILALELLLFEFRSRSFIPLVIASASATAVHFALLGRGPLFAVEGVDYGVPTNIPYYALFGMLAGLGAVAMTKGLFWVEDHFEKLPLNPMWWPALGGLGLGLIGYAVPQVLGVGYGTIGDILNGRLALGLLVMIALCKAVALLVSLGSGTSGGLLAPMFMTGAAMGGVFALAANRLLPGAHLSPSAFALVGMAALFGASARATFTLIIFAFEITRDYNAILPLMVVCVIADGVGLLFLRNTIMTEKLARRGLRVQGDLDADALQQLTVGEVMDRHPVTLPAKMPLSELAESMARGGGAALTHQAFPLVDGDGSLVGIITRGDVVRALEERPSQGVTLLDAGSAALVVASPGETVREAVSRMLENGVGRLPVVDPADPRHLVGYFSRSAVLMGYVRKMEEERVLEPPTAWPPLLKAAVRRLGTRRAAGS